MSWDAIADNARLSALRELGIIDTDPEAEFDRFTALTAELLGAPISTITLIDHDRQFWKSAYGITGSWAEARGTPLSHSLCQEPVATGTPLVLSDLRADGERADCLALRDLDVVAYAGMPLVLADGFAVGALCAIDHEPHEWDERELRILSELAQMVSSMLDLRRSLNQQMLHDPLTGLPNRALTVSYGEQLSSAEDTGDLLALAIGIDRLGSLSEVHGVMRGDHLINLLARRIAHQLSIEDVLGRLQNDVFAVLRPRLEDHAEALDLAHRIRGAVCSDPITFQGEPMVVSATVGMAIAGPGIDGDTLIGRALSSLERARAQEDDVAMFAPRTAGETPVRSRVRGALAGAVQRGEIFVNFQPIVELATGETAGYEALARWRHPELGLIGPSEFIPVAEATGDIVIIGEHVLRTACNAAGDLALDGPRRRSRRHRQRLAAPTRGARRREAGPLDPRRGGAARVRAHARDHREDLRLPGAGATHQPGGDPRAGRPRRARRLRHRILGAQLPQALPRRHDQGRPLLPAGHGDRSP